MDMDDECLYRYITFKFYVIYLLKEFIYITKLEMFCHSEGQNRTRSPECLSP
jgi:hypothetical protein